MRGGAWSFVSLRKLPQELFVRKPSTWPRDCTLPASVSAQRSPTSRPAMATSLVRLQRCFPAARTRLASVARHMSASAPPSAGAVGPDSVMEAPLKCAEDSYNGVLVDEGALPSSPGEFHGLLRASIDAWRAQGKRGVWLRVPTSKAALAGPAAELGFEFHSASPGWVLMTRWLPSGPNTLPAGASHQVGVGAIVVNSKGELLVVQERNGPLKGTGVWKMPTGLSDYGEDVMDTAVREVHEEAGIDCVAEGIIAIRQMHGLANGSSDLFVVVGCRPVDESQVVVAQEAELVGAKWMPLEEYRNIEFMRRRALYAKLVDRCVAWAKGEVPSMRGEKLDAGFNRGAQWLFTV